MPPVASGGIAAEIVRAVARDWQVGRAESRMVNRRSILSAFFAVFVLLISSAARADPVTITAGNAFIAGDLSFGFFQLIGAGGEAQGAGTGGVGSTLGLGLSATATDLNGQINPSPFYQGSATIGATTFSIPGFAGANWSGHYTFTTVPFLLPAVPEGTPITVFSPFTMQGTLEARDGSPPNSPLLFSVDVVGSGIASAGLTGHAQADGRTAFLNQSGVSYVFDAAPAATPEPSTWLLMATGFALVGATLRWRRSTA